MSEAKCAHFGNADQKGFFKFLITIPFILFNSAISAQTFPSGRIIDNDSTPIRLASIHISKNGSSIYATTTNEEGRFQIAQKLEHGLSYSLTITSIGFKTLKKDFIFTDSIFNTPIILQRDTTVLSTVNVSSTKPLIETRTDRYIINVENSFLQNGNSGIDVLQKSPGIWVDNNGSIHIKGSLPVTVMINDVIQRMSDTELTEYLRTLRSEDISKIEIIHNPPAEYEAAGAGGIIHIILRKARKNGLNGTVNTQYKQQGNNAQENIGASLDYKFNKYYVFGSASLTNDRKDIFEKASINYSNNDFYQNITNRTDKYTTRQYRVGATYNITSDHSISAQMSSSESKFLQNFETNIDYDKLNQPITGVALTNRHRRITFQSSTFNYTWKIDSLGSGFKLIADYTNNKRTENGSYSEQYSDPSDDLIFRNSIPANTDIYTSQADFTKILRTGLQIKAGAKAAYINRQNKILKEDYSTSNGWVTNIQGTDNFIYKEKLLMFYSTIEKTINRTGIKAGLRGEQTNSEGNSITLHQIYSRKYFSLFPSFFISQALNENGQSNIYFNYSRRLRRPTLSELNPNRSQFSNYTAEKGDPTLLPQFSNSFDAGYNISKALSLSFFLTKTKNTITLVADSAVNNIIEYRTKNLHNSQQYGANFNAFIQPLKNWSINNSLSFYNSSYTFENSGINQTAVYARTVHSFSLTNLFDIDLVASYQSRTMYGNIRTSGIFSTDMGFTKKVFKKRGQLRLSFTDIFNTLREKEITKNSEAYIYFYRKRPTQTGAIFFSYNFVRGKKFSTKPIEQSSGDERGRLGY